MTKCNHSSDRRCINCDDSSHCYGAETPMFVKPLGFWARLVARVLPVPTSYFDTTRKPHI